MNLVKIIPRYVSILVSIWMHLEGSFVRFIKERPDCFNPSFYMDASGRVDQRFGTVCQIMFQS